MDNNFPPAHGWESGHSTKCIMTEARSQIIDNGKTVTFYSICGYDRLGFCGVSRSLDSIGELYISGRSEYTLIYEQ